MRLEASYLSSASVFVWKYLL